MGSGLGGGNHLVASWLEYYHTERQQSKENELLVPLQRTKKRSREPLSGEVPKVRDVQCERLLLVDLLFRRRPVSREPDENPLCP